MTKFTAKLAGIPIGITALYETTAAGFQEYQTAEPPVFSVTSTREALLQERKLIVRYREEPAPGALPRTVRELEEQFVYHAIAARLPAYDAVLFHGSAIAVDGAAYLFVAPSGTGKSTHTRLWREKFGSRGVMINDDRPLLRITQAGVMACGSPWRGKHRLGSNLCVPLEAVCLLERGETNRITALDAGGAFPELVRHCYRSGSPENAAQVLALLTRLTERVRLYRLWCNMTPAAASVAYEAMTHKEA